MSSCVHRTQMAGTARARARSQDGALGYRDARRRDDATMTTTRESVDDPRARAREARRRGGMARDGGIDASGV